MSIEAQTYPDATTIVGSLAVVASTRTGAAGNVACGSLAEAQTTGTVQTLTTGNTITVPAGTGVVRVTAGGAVTGIILPAGTVPGQNLSIIHEGAAANTITFAAAGTSNVADGTSDVITGPTCRSFIWDSITALWYACK